MKSARTLSSRMRLLRGWQWESITRMRAATPNLAVRALASPAHASAAATGERQVEEAEYERRVSCSAASTS
jgi:hypothetical protein